MRAGSSNDFARDCLTKSSRLVDFCTSWDSFYGLNSSTGLSSLYTQRCVNHPSDVWLNRSPSCSFGPLLPSHFTLSPFYSLLCIYSAPSRWLTVSCGTKTAPDWKCLSPRGGLGPTSGQGNGPQGGAEPAWPHTMSMSSSRMKEEENHQHCSSLRVPMRFSSVKKSLHRRGFTDYFRGFITSVFEVIKWCSSPKNNPYPVI